MKGRSASRFRQALSLRVADVPVTLAAPNALVWCPLSSFNYEPRNTEHAETPGLFFRVFR